MVDSIENAFDSIHNKAENSWQVVQVGIENIFHVELLKTMTRVADNLKQFCWNSPAGNVAENY